MSFTEDVMFEELCVKVDTHLILGGGKMFETRVRFWQTQFIAAYREVISQISETPSVIHRLEHSLDSNHGCRAIHLLVI